MKKKITSMLVAFVLSLSMVVGVLPLQSSAYSSSAYTYSKCYKVPKFKGAYGKFAYETLEYIDTNLRERIAGTEQEVKACEYLTGILESYGYKVTIQPFTYQRRGVDYNSQNIIVTKPGKSKKEVVVGAHYDSVKTSGVCDNASGTVVNLETALRMKNVSTPYTIKFVFFGAEEVGLKGSKAYVDSLTQEQKDNIVYMVNMDGLLAGTYRYIYGGNYNEETQEVEKAWAVYQAMQLAKGLDLGVRLNDTELNIKYPTPTTGNWSDHASFRSFAPYIYFEAANWEIPYPDPANPATGSNGWYETETGPVMHYPERDDLTFIENEWGNRGRENISAFCELLTNILKQVSPDGLIKPSTDALVKAIEKAEKINTKNLKKNDLKKLEKALDKAKDVLESDKVVLLSYKKTIDKATKDLNSVVKTIEKKYKVCDKKPAKKPVQKSKSKK